MGRKEGGLLRPFRGWLGTRPIQSGLGRGLLPYQVASTIHPAVWPIAVDMGQMLGWGGCALFSGGSWVPINHKVAWAEAYLHTKWHLDSPAVWPQQEGQHPLTGQRAPPISGGT